MTKRKADMARVATALGLPLVSGETTSELAARCESRAAELLEMATAIDDIDETEDQAPAEPPAEEREPSQGKTRAGAPRPRKAKKATRR